MNTEDLIGRGEISKEKGEDEWQDCNSINDHEGPLFSLNPTI